MKKAVLTDMELGSISAGKGKPRLCDTVKVDMKTSPPFYGEDSEQKKSEQKQMDRPW